MGLVLVPIRLFKQSDDEVLLGSKADDLPQLLWRSVPFANRKIWNGIDFKTGDDFYICLANPDETQVLSTEQWKLPLILISNPELFRNNAIHKRFLSLLKIDRFGKYQDDWQSRII